MKKYKYLLWDIDGTILNFLAAEKAAIRRLFLQYGFGECTDEMLAEYSAINLRYWQALERNEITKDEVLVGRYIEFFTRRGLPTDKARAFNDDYQLALGDTIVFCDESDKLLTELHKDYILAAVTNGTKEAQNKKLKESGLDRIFDYIFISEVIGIEKPNKGFFDVAFEQMQLKDLSEALMIGDSLTSDIRGGSNAGVDTCWYNPRELHNDTGLVPTYEIANLQEIRTILAVEEKEVPEEEV